jgi:hypothetical protein
MAKFGQWGTLGLKGLDLSTSGFEKQYSHLAETQWDESTRVNQESPYNSLNYGTSVFSLDGSRYHSIEIENYQVGSGIVSGPSTSEVYIIGDPDPNSVAEPTWYLAYNFSGRVGISASGEISGSFSSFTRSDKSNGEYDSAWKAEGGTWNYNDYWGREKSSGPELHSFFFAGNDQLTGTSLSDRLDGGPGDDLIIGGSGNDQIIDSSGRNYIQGEGGADIFFLPVFGSAGYWSRSVSDSDLWWDTRQVKRKYRVRRNGRKTTKTRLVTEYYIDNELNIISDFNPAEDELYEQNGDGVYGVENFGDGGYGISLWDGSELNCYAYLNGVTEAQYLQYLNG